MDLDGQFDVLEVVLATEVDSELRAQALQMNGDPVHVLGAEGVRGDRDDEEAGARILLPGVEGRGIEGETGTAVDGEEFDHESEIAAFDPAEGQQGTGEGGLGIDRGRPTLVLRPPFGDSIPAVGEIGRASCRERV